MILRRSASKGSVTEDPVHIPNGCDRLAYYLGSFEIYFKVTPRLNDNKLTS